MENLSKQLVDKSIESFTYSQQFIEFIVNEIKKNPTRFVDSLKNKKR